ncbi:ABC transporter substrate-binding protein [Ferrimonas kyonanensis]|uniref:ABC transporter substrate-binding protein n=1 Tax=Ferrimonas kyonanensis TaxID=364763 RepID=UPI000428E8D2|nr:ABC transporter substrate-binding protein [Ferrimonas kyonanensis]
MDQHRPAERIIALNQHATEALLTLGLGPKLIGTAYLDEAVKPELQHAYEGIPVLSREYPSAEQVLLSGADLLVAGFASAYRDMGIGPRQRWQQRGMQTYLFESVCAPEAVGVDSVFTDMRQLGRLTGTEDVAEAWIASQRQRLAEIATTPPARAPRMLVWLREYELPYVAGCCGIGNLLIEAAGGVNVGAGIGRAWGHLSWEAVLAARPEIILMVDSNWSPQLKKRQFLHQSPYLKSLYDSGHLHLDTLSFSETVGGVRMIDGIDKAHRAVMAWQS